MALSAADLEHLSRCVKLARAALNSGNAPFGAILIDGSRRILYEAHNLTGGGDVTRHPEFAIAHWATANLPPVRRIRATVYTSCEHCPMCAAAHGWAGLGRIVYATSAAQLWQWLSEWQAPVPLVAPLPITTVVPKAIVDGPAPALQDEMKTLYEAKYRS